jgi:hypothetical protein
MKRPVPVYAGLELHGHHPQSFSLVIPGDRDAIGTVRKHRKMFTLTVKGHAFISRGLGIIPAGQPVRTRSYTTWKQAVRAAAEIIEARHEPA